MAAAVGRNPAVGRLILTRNGYAGGDRLYRVAVTDLRPGMRLGLSVHSADGVVLLRAGVELRGTYIDQLRRLGIAAVYVANPLAPDVAPPDLVSEQTRARLGSSLLEISAHVRLSLSEGSKGPQRRWLCGQAALREALDAVVDEVLRHPNAMIHLRDIRAADEYTLGHSINVCILSTLLGVSQGLSVPQLKELALGALLHDVGKLSISPEILKKEGALSQAEVLQMREHTTRGFEILRRNPEVSLLVAHVAFQHHERWDGGGYPRGLVGKEILPYARMVSVADVYDALVSDRVYRPGLPPRRALALMQQGSSGFFEPALLLTFTAHVALYPVGSLVQLTDGSTAVVVAVRRGDAEHPVVRVVKGPDGLVLDRQYDVDLGHTPSSEVERLLSEEPLAVLPRAEEVAALSI